jgi:glycosyltransferase involved in cell wall biosynthesis
MKICVYADTFFPCVGGCEIYSGGLARQFKKMGHDVFVCASWSGAERNPQQELVDGIQVTRYWYPIPKMVLKHLLAFPFIFPLTLIQLAAKLRKEKPDLVIQQYLASNTFYLWCLRKFGWLLGVPKFFWVGVPQGTDIQERIYEHWFHMWMMKAALRECDFVGGSSTYVMEEARKLVPEVTNKSAPILTAIALEDFVETTTKHEHPREYILCLGRYVDKKGQDLLIDAFATVALDYDDVDLIFVGFGPNEKNLKDLTHSHELDDRVHFVDGKSLTREQTVEYFNGAYITTLPSRLEVYGQVGVEGMAAGKPLVASYVDGFPEVSGVTKKYDTTQNAILTDPTVEGIEKGLKMALELTEDERNAMTERAKKHAFDNYAYETACLKYIEAYEEGQK